MNHEKEENYTSSFLQNTEKARPKQLLPTLVAAKVTFKIPNNPCELKLYEGRAVHVVPKPLLCATGIEKIIFLD